MNYKRILCACIATLMAIAALLPAAVFADGEEVLSTGKSYTVVYESPIDQAYPVRAYKPESALTDGNFASSSASDPAYLKLYRGTIVSVTIDLESVCAVTSVDLHTLHMKGAGIYSPRVLSVAVSEDGTSFGTVGTLSDPKTPLLANPQKIKQTIKLDRPYRARYVRLNFNSDVYVYADEVVVNGTKEVGDAASAEADAPVEDRGYANPIDGIGNIVLLYTVGNYNEANLRPYVAYVDTQGKAIDTNFDAALFLPSGASNYDFQTQAGWEKYISDMFGKASNTNLTAMNNVVRTLKGELSLDDDFRYPVFLSVPFLSVGTEKIFGKAPDSLANRSAIIRTAIDKMLAEFSGSNFDCLELKGFYWHEELIPYTLTDYEEELMKQFNDYVHAKGYKSIWIPYYCAPGFERAVDLGFDAATLQSGYAFKPRDSAEIGNVQPGAVVDSASKAHKFGLGMEFELDLGATDFLKRYLKYLHTGSTTGCMEGHMMMMYQSVHALRDCANSAEGTDKRRVYDLTYLYNKQKLTFNAPTVESDQVIVATVGGRASGRLTIVDEDSSKSDLSIVDLTVTEGLVFALEKDGFYILNTTKSVPGVYNATFKVSDGFNLSEEASATIILIDAEKSGTAYTLEKDLQLYDRLNTEANGEILKAKTDVKVIAIDDSWCCIAYTVDDKAKYGFVPKSEVSVDSPVPGAEVESSSPAEAGDASTDENNVSDPEKSEGTDLTILLIVIGGVAVVLAAVVVVVILMKKKKTKK